MSLKRDNSDELFLRASKVIPGGIYGHVTPVAGLPRHFPHYTESALGCRFKDVDGNEWIDFMCGLEQFCMVILNQGLKLLLKVREVKAQFLINQVR